jgi:hypothetical protein
MRRIVLLALSGAMLIPCLARAGFGNSQESGTYGFGFTMTTTNQAALCSGTSTSSACGKTNNVTGSFTGYYKKFGTDLSKKTCSGVSSSLTAQAAAISSIVFTQSSVISGAGNITFDGSGNISDGDVTFGTNLAGAQAVNASNAGTTALVCGGSASSLSSSCASVCGASSVSCNTLGGYTTSSSGTGTATLYLFPVLAAGLCGSTPVSAYRCCSDPSLVIILHVATTLSQIQAGSAVANEINGSFTDQQGGGNFQASLQQLPAVSTTP